MSGARKLQTEIERVMKKVDEGVDLFDEIWEKVYSAEHPSHKEKYEMDLKKEIKKLQRQRDQIKSWISSSEVKDKDSLVDARRLIETKMEQFKICEKETKTKQYSKEGLARAEKLSPEDEAKQKTIAWISDIIGKLNQYVEEREVEIERLSTGKGKKSNKHLIEEYSQYITNHKFHITTLEGIMRLVNNDRLDVEKVEEIKDDLEYYLEAHEEDDYIQGYDEELFYESLGLDGLDIVMVDRVTQPTVSSSKSSKSSGSREDDDSASERSGSRSSRSSKKPSSSSGMIPLTIGRARVSKDDSKDKSSGSTPTKGGRGRDTSSGSRDTSDASSVGSGGRGGGAGHHHHGPPPSLVPAPTALHKVAAPPPGGASMAAILKREGEQQEKERQKALQQQQQQQQQQQLLREQQRAEQLRQQHLRQQQEAQLRQQQEAQLRQQQQQQAQAEALKRQQQQQLQEQQARQEAAAKQQQQQQLKAQQQAQQQAAQQQQAAAAAAAAQQDSLAKQQQQQTAVQQAAAAQQHQQAAAAAAAAQQQQSQQPNSGALENLLTSGLGGLTLGGGMGSEANSPSNNATGSPTAVSPQQQQQAAAAAAAAAAAQQQPLVGQQQPQQHQHPVHGVAFDSSSSSPSYLLGALNDSFLHCPSSMDSDRQRSYTPRNPYPTPNSYPTSPSLLFENPAIFEKLGTDCLFFIFYYAQGTYQQYLAARELKKQSWRYHKKYMTWFQRHEEPKITTDEYEQGTYVYFDYESGWCQRIKSDFRFEYSFLEDSLIV